MHAWQSQVWCAGSQFVFLTKSKTRFTFMLAILALVRGIQTSLTQSPKQSESTMHNKVESQDFP